jgi:ribose-phosphate pyrophosphokinase
MAAEYQMDRNEVLLFACSKGAEQLTDDICSELGISRSKYRMEEFSNGNHMPKLRAPDRRDSYSLRGRHVWLVQTIDGNIDRRWAELILMIDAAKQSHAERVGVILPYLFYSRSDKKDQARVGCGLKAFIKSIEAQGLGYAVICDPHNLASMQYFSVPVDCITARQQLGDYVETLGIEAVIAPDAGSVKRASKLAKRLNVPSGYIDKYRGGNDDKSVPGSLSGVDVRGRRVLVLDDEADTCGTIVGAAQLLKTEGAAEIYLAFTHIVLSGEAIERLAALDIVQLIATDTVPHPAQQLALVADKVHILPTGKLFAETIYGIEKRKSLGNLYDFVV